MSGDAASLAMLATLQTIGAWGLGITFVPLVVLRLLKRAPGAAELLLVAFLMSAGVVGIADVGIAWSTGVIRSAGNGVSRTHRAAEPFDFWTSFTLESAGAVACSVYGALRAARALRTG